MKNLKLYCTEYAKESLAYSDLYPNNSLLITGRTEKISMLSIVYDKSFQEMHYEMAHAHKRNENHITLFTIIGCTLVFLC